MSLSKFYFSLGCGIGFGYLHRIPIRRKCTADGVKNDAKENIDPAATTPGTSKHSDTVVSVTNNFASYVSYCLFIFNKFSSKKFLL
jgi:hypothetical protein